MAVRSRARASPHAARPPRAAAAPSPRVQRSDGAQTWRQILEIAGRIYADKGFARTTSREICAAAGTNMAAVNYHFGGKGGLYEAVLVEAHGQLVELGALEAIAQSELDATDRLRALIALFAARAAAPELPWGLRVLLQALMQAPTPHLAALMQRAILPKIRLAMGIVADVIGVPPDDPRVQRGLAFVVMPCVLMALAPRERLRQVLPAVASDAQALADDLTAYAIAGLAALARRPPTPAAANARRPAAPASKARPRATRG